MLSQDYVKRVTQFMMQTGGQEREYDVYSRKTHYHPKEKPENSKSKLVRLTFKFPK